MAQPCEAITDRLIDIIASIKLGRKSGQLRVRRGEGLTSEDGLLTFMCGQVTQAQIGRRSGADALNWLSTWGQAHYTFFSTASDEETSPAFFARPPVFPDRAAFPTDPPVTHINTDDLALTQRSVPVSGYEVPRTSLILDEAITLIEQAGLSRAHRRLYLLVDGQRSPYELAPLSGKKVEEVRSMLRDLEWLGVIQQTKFPA